MSYSRSPYHYPPASSLGYNKISSNTSVTAGGNNNNSHNLQKNKITSKTRPIDFNNSYPFQSNISNTSSSFGFFASPVIPDTPPSSAPNSPQMKPSSNPPTPSVPQNQQQQQQQ